jgi:hypothetical protein
MAAAKKQKARMRKLEDIIWIHTPKCAECAEYNVVLKKCRREICKFPSKR